MSTIGPSAAMGIGRITPRRLSGKRVGAACAERMETRRLLSGAPDTFDTTFGVGGAAIVNLDANHNEPSASEVLVQPDGKILIVGSVGGDPVNTTTRVPTGFLLARFKPDGSPDTSFGTGGVALTDFGGDIASSAVLEANGDIVVVGQSNGLFAVARFTPNGKLDSTFGTGGLVTTNVGTSLVTPDAVSAVALSGGKLLVSGYDSKANLVEVRYNANGALDAAFGTKGIKHFPTVAALSANFLTATQKDGKLISACEAPAPGDATYSNYVWTLTRTTAAGATDTTFGTDGTVPLLETIDGGVHSLSVPEAVAIEPDGSILVAGVQGIASPGGVDATLFAIKVFGGSASAPATPLKVRRVSNAGGTAVAVADLNGDGHADLVIAGYGGGNDVAVKLGSGKGNFSAAQVYATGSDPVAVTVADVNGDGKPDLIVTDKGDNTVSVLLNKGNGKFAGAVKYAAGSHPVGVAVADFNGDGKPDLAIADAGASASTGGVSLLLNKGKGIFGAARQVAVTGALDITAVAAGDIDGNGTPDLVLSAEDANGNYPSLVNLLNQGGAVFGPADVEAYTFSNPANPGPLILGDFTGPGPLTAAVIDKSLPGAFGLPGNIAVSANDFGQGGQGGTLVSGTNNECLSSPLAMAAGTFNGDGRLGLAAIDQTSNKLYILNGNDNGTFTPGANYVAPAGVRDVAAASFKADGGYTIAVAGAGGVDVYYH